MVASLFSQQQHRNPPPPSGVTWNPADKSAFLTLSGGDLTATGAGYPNVRSTTSKASGKWYYETTFDDVNDIAFAAIGLANELAVITADLGVDTTAALAFAEGIIVYNAATSAIGTWTTGDKVGIAVDVDAALMWASVNGVFTGSPVLGTGGVDITGLCATGEVFALASGAADTVSTTNFGGSAFTHAAPATFSAWDAATTWNPADKSTLSGGNLVATMPTGTDDNARSTTSHTTGKRYFEVVLDTLSSDGGIGAGCATSAFVLGGTIGVDTISVAYYPYGALYYDDTENPADPSVEGDVIGIAVDIDNGLIWASVNGVFTGDPAAGTAGVDISVLCADPVFAIGGTQRSADELTANFGATAFNTAPPTGFVAWDA